jgi:RimK family alpha-L-glutamate ligase
MFKKLRIAVITNKELHTLKTKIRPAAEKRGHVIEVLSPLLVDHTNLINSTFVQSLLNYDVVYYRSGFSISGAYTLGQYLRSQKIPTVNFFHEKFPYYQHKLFQVQVVSAAGFLVPKTISGSNCSFTTLAEALKVPFIAKPDVGSQGAGVYKIDSSEDFDLMKKKNKTGTILYQEFIPHDYDYRIPVIDGKAVCPYKRVPLLGEFRANVTLGGKTEKVEEGRLDELSLMSEMIAKVCGIEIMGVDLLLHRETEKLYFTEVNDNPGWKNVAEALGEDPSEAVIDYFEKLATETK